MVSTEQLGTASTTAEDVYLVENLFLAEISQGAKRARSECILPAPG